MTPLTLWTHYMDNDPSSSLAEGCGELAGLADMLGAF